jgi:hypothetical protein
MPIPDRQELLELAGEQARKGSVTAIKLLLEEDRRNDDPHSGETGIEALYEQDELAKRRKSA